MNSLIEAKKDVGRKTLLVDKLPESGMLMHLDIGDKYTDMQLKELLEIDYEIIVRE
jgi:hypothetical protein